MKIKVNFLSDKPSSYRDYANSIIIICPKYEISQHNAMYKINRGTIYYIDAGCNENIVVRTHKISELQDYLDLIKKSLDNKQRIEEADFIEILRPVLPTTFTPR